MKRSFFQRFARPIILLVAVLIPLTAWAAMLALATNKNDVSEWLPQSFEATREYHWFQQHFGNETFVLASWDGCTVEDERLDRFAKYLSPATSENDVHYFDMVITTRDMLDRLTSPPTSLSRKQALERIKGSFIGPDLQHACAVLRLSATGNERLREAVAEIYTVAALRVGIPREQIHLGGPPVDNATIDAEGERMLPTLMVLCSAVGLSLAWWYLRDVRLTLMVFVGGAYCGALGLALVYVLGGRMDSVLLTMPAVVYTAGLSAAIHLVNYYRHGRAQEGLVGAAERGLKAAWIPCLLSASTTALGLISLCTSDLVPIRNFGFYTAVGVMSALGFIFLYLPAALQIWPPTVTAAASDETGALDPRHRRRMRWLATRLTAHPLKVWIVFAAAGISCGAGLYKVKTTINLMSLFPADAEIIQSYRYLEKKIGPLVPMEVVVHLDKNSEMTFLDRLQLIGRIQEEIEQIPHVGSVTSAATYTPSLTPPKSTGLRGVLVNESTYRNILNRRLVAHRDDFVRDGYIGDDRETGHELWRISMRVAALAGVDYGAFIEDIRQRVEPLVEEERETTPEIAKVTYTGMTAVVYMAERALLNGLVKSFFEAFVMMSIIMSFVFRDLRAGLYTMLPNVWPMAVVFGLMSWFDIALDIGTMMTASVAMGVCVDDMVHFANWFRRASRLGLNHHDAAVLAFENSAGAIYQSTMIVALGLVTFGLSTFMPTRRFGLLMCTLLCFGLVADLGLSPAMLAGRIGRFFTVGIRLRKPPSPGDETGPEGLREDEGSILA